MKAIILSAGLGTRLMPLTKDTPKPMLPVNGKPIIQHNIEWLKSNGITEIGINLHHLPDKIKEYLGNGSKFGVRITYSHERGLLGTAGGVKNFERFIGNVPFIVYYGDNLTSLNLKGLLDFHGKKKGIATICLHAIEEKELRHSSIIVIDGNSRILKFIEKPDKSAIRDLKKKIKVSSAVAGFPAAQRAAGNPANCYSNAGIYCLEPEILGHIEKGKFSDFAKDVLPRLTSENEKLFGYPLSGCFWAELGTLEKYEKAKKSAL